MQESYHIIGQYVFDIHYTERQKAFELQSRFSRLFYDQSVPVMEEVFDRCVPEEIVLRLETLTLDIGVFRYDRIEKDFRERFREALEKEMERLLSEYTRQEGVGRNRSLTDLLEYFLTTGTLPWWVTGDLLTDPVAVAERLVRDDPSGLRKVLLTAGQKDLVRRRLVFQFPGTTIRQMVEVLEPEEASFIFVYQSEIIRIQEAEQVFRQEINEFEKDIWGFIFTYLLVDRGSNFNRKIFVKSAVGQMARRWNLEYAALLSVLFRALELGSPTLVMRSPLSGIIHTLFYEEEQESVKEQAVSAARQVQGKMERIRQYLMNLSSPIGAYPYDVAALSRTFMELMAQVPASTQEMIRSLGMQEGLWIRVVRGFDEEVLSGLIRLREPNEADFILYYGKKLEILQREKLLVKTESEGFYQSVWELILTFLWSERGNLFNTRVFLEYNVRQMAMRYHLPYRQLLAFLVQGIGQDIRSDKDGSLFQSLAFLLKEENEAMVRVEIRTQKEKRSAYVEVPMENGGLSTGVEAPMQKGGPSDRGGRNILEYWLIHGDPPVWASRDEVYSPRHLLARMLEEDPLAVIGLLKYAGERLEWQQRMLYQLPLQLLFSIFRLLPGGSWAISLYEEAALVPGNEDVLSVGDRTIRAELLRLLWNGFKEGYYRSFDPETYMERSVAYLSTVTRGRASLPATGSSEEAKAKHVKEEGATSGEESATAHMKEKETTSGELAMIAKELEQRLAWEEEDKKKRERPSKRQGIEGTFYIHNAGLVLLHPLLSHFFSRLGLTEKGQFFHEEARQRAVHLLQLLVDGRSEHPEQELVLNKILCEIAPETSLARRITVTEKEAVVGRELLEVVLQRWEKMNNTSVEGLQLSFLQRGGALARTQDGWKLRVEQKGIDVLLPYLPWSWGMIKLPWMNQILYVEWI